MGRHRKTMGRHRFSSSAPLFICLSVYLSLFVSIDIIVFLSFSVSLFVCQSVCLSLCLSVCLSIFLSVYLSVRNDTSRIYMYIHIQYIHKIFTYNTYIKYSSPAQYPHTTAIHTPQTQVCAYLYVYDRERCVYDRERCMCVSL